MKYSILLCVLLLGCGKEGSMPTQRQLREWPTLMKVAREYRLSSEDTIMLLAIREAEGGGVGFELGVKAAKNTSLDEQARWAAGSIRANRTRYQQLKQEGVYKGSNRMVGLGLKKDITLDKDTEKEFRKWYKGEVANRGLNPNPDDPLHYFAYRAFWKDMVKGDTEAGAHFPSEYKKVGHIGSEYAAVAPDIDFSEFFAYYASPTGYGWAPIHGDMPEEERELNKNWAGNVRKLTEKFTKLFKEKGVIFDESK